MRIAVERGRSVNAALMIGICGEHGGDPASVRFCHELGLDYVSCSPYRVPVARLAAAQAALGRDRRRVATSSPAADRRLSSTAAPRTAPLRNRSSARSASESGNTSTVVVTGWSANARNSSWPSCRVRFATERSTRSPQRSSYGKDGIALMWMPAQTTVPPLRDRRQRLGDELACGGEDDRGVELLRPLADGPARTAPSSRASDWAASSPGRVKAKTRRPSWRASWATMCAAAPKP